MFCTIPYRLTPDSHVKEEIATGEEHAADDGKEDPHAPSLEVLKARYSAFKVSTGYGCPIPGCSSVIKTIAHVTYHIQTSHSVRDRLGVGAAVSALVFVLWHRCHRLGSMHKIGNSVIETV